MGTPDTTADTDTVTSAKDPLTLNPKLKLNPATDTNTVDTMAVPTDTTDTVILAKGPLKANLSLTTDTDTVDTMVIPWILWPWILLGLKWILLVKMLKKPLNYLQDQVTRILSIWLLFPPFFDGKCLFFTIIS